MKKISLLIALLLGLSSIMSSQIDSTRVIDNKGTIKYVVKNNGAIVTLNDSTSVYVTPTQLGDSLEKFIDSGYNGLTKSGRQLKLGGKLIEVTTIEASPTNLLKLLGIQNSTDATDSVLTIGADGTLKKISASDLISKTTYKNGLRKDNDTIKLGGDLTENTTIDLNGNKFIINGVLGGSSTDSILVLEKSTNEVKKIAATDLVKAGNGLTRSGDSVILGGILDRDTKIVTNGYNLTFEISNGDTFIINGTTRLTTMPQGVKTDSVVVRDPSTGDLKMISASTLLDNLIAKNGLTKNGDTFVLGGKLDRNTTIDVDGKQLMIQGLKVGTSADSVLVLDNTSNELKKVSLSQIVKVGNGLQMSNDTVVLGGTLDRATNIATGGFGLTVETQASDSFTVKGTTVLDGTVKLRPLTQGVETDSVVVRDPATGQLKVVSASTLLKNLKAVNGLTKSNDTIYLGGDLIQNTTISTAGRVLDLKQTGSNDSIKISGLQSGNTTTDSIVLVNGATGRLTRISATGMNKTKTYTEVKTNLSGTTTYTIPQATSSIPSNYGTSQVWVYRNGIKLIAGVDYTVTSGDVNITPQTGASNMESWEWGAYERLELQWVQ